ncbi:MAG: FhaA domain-containing protein [Acidimicrobiia bacterium]
MKLARELERRLEAALDGLAGRLFRGGLHPSELASRIGREAELAEFDTVAGPATANHFRLLLHPSNLASTEGAGNELAAHLTTAFAAHAADRGWRLQGPPSVTVESDPDLAPRTAKCQGSVVPGPLQPWARLKGSTTHEISPNRALLGRGTDCDIVLIAAEVSRHHAIVFRQDGQAFVIDLDSVNGTFVDGTRVGRVPLRITNGSMLNLAGAEFRFSSNA